MISPDQCRAARALVKISTQSFCELANINRKTLLQFESGGSTANTATRARLLAAFQCLSIEFVKDGDGVGVQRISESGPGRSEGGLIDSTSKNEDRAELGSAMTPAMWRAARALVNLSQGEIAARARVGLDKVVALETGACAVSASRTRSITEVYEALGVVISVVDGAAAVHLGPRWRARESSQVGF